MALSRFPHPLTYPPSPRALSDRAGRQNTNPSRSSAGVASFPVVANGSITIDNQPVEQLDLLPALHHALQVAKEFHLPDVPSPFQ